MSYDKASTDQISQLVSLLAKSIGVASSHDIRSSIKTLRTVHQDEDSILSIDQLYDMFENQLFLHDPTGVAVSKLNSCKRRLDHSGEIASDLAPFSKQQELLTCFAKISSIIPFKTSAIPLSKGIKTLKITKDDESISTSNINSRLELPLHGQEVSLMRDLVYICQGINGKFLHLNEKKDAILIPSSIDNQSVSLSISTQCSSIGELGCLYSSIVSNLSLFKQGIVNRATSSIVHEAFMNAIQFELDLYFQSIADLKSNIDDSLLKSSSHVSSDGNTSWNLRRMLVWSEPILSNLKTLSELINVAIPCSSHALLSQVYLYYKHSPIHVQDSSNFLYRIFSKTSHPFTKITLEFLMQGVINSFVQQEYFIQFSSIESASGNSNGENDEFRSNRDAVESSSSSVKKNILFIVKKDQIPVYISQDLAQAILECGQLMNILSFSCNDSTWLNQVMTPIFSELTKNFDKVGNDQPFLTTNLYLKTLVEGNDASNMRIVEAIIMKVRPLLNNRLVTLLKTKFNLKMHFQALQRYLLLAKGDFASSLLDAAVEVLSQPSSGLVNMKHILDNLLESALRMSNATMIEPDEIINRLYTRTASSNSAKVSGWDIFIVSYSIPYAISQVITDDHMERYAKLFQFYFKIKRAEHALSSTWASAMTSSHSLRRLGHQPLQKVLHGCHLIRQDMANLLQQLCGYLFFEVLGTFSSKLLEEIDSASTVQELFDSHEKFLFQVEENSLQTPECSTTMHLLDTIIQQIITFSNMQQDLLSKAVLQANSKAKEIIGNSTSIRGNVLYDNADSVLARSRIGATLDNLVSSVGPAVGEILATYRNSVGDLLDSMQLLSYKHSIRSSKTSSHTLGDLRLLAQRFDFNEFYSS
jgi:gamma-tubulin complex component 3